MSELTNRLRNYLVSAPPEHPLSPMICHEAAAEIERHEAKLAALPSQETIDTVAEGLAWEAIDRASFVSALKASGLYKEHEPQVDHYALLLTLLGIPDGSDWAADVLENHHAGPGELVDALRQLKDMHEMPLPEPDLSHIAEAQAAFAAGQYQTPQEIIDELKAKEPEEPTPGIVESYVIEKTAICKQCDESIRWTGKYWEHIGTQYRHMGQPKGEDA